ncbi:MAG: CusA/CzcA family heavy metal efflux RND transporter, partial [Ferruginibacter sp.]|nr:CusA/CzcA family heavy metal efflux RND transporter [Cytophagales bacterium]
VGGIVLMLKGENSSKVIRAVKARIATIGKTLPEGVEVVPFLDRTKLVNNAIHTVSRNLAEGALIVVFVLVLLLGNLRAGLVVASVIPLSLLFAIALMNLFGVSGNLMSLGAIDFGLIVDGAIIIVEAVLHGIAVQRFSHALSQPQMDGEVYRSASNIRHSATFGEIIILIVYLPILALVGVEGKMFRPMAQTVTFAILGAFVLSLTYVPMVSALLLSKQPVHRRTLSDRFIGRLQRAYRPALEWALEKKVLVVGTSLALFAASLLVFARLGGEFIPTLDEGDFAVETTLLPGSSLTQTVETFRKAGKILLEFPEVKEVVGKIGSSEIPVDPMPVNNGDLIVVLKDRSGWKTAQTREELAERMKERLSALPGVTFGFQQPIQMRFNELMTGARQDVVLMLFGEDLGVLTREADRLAGLVRRTAGATDVYVERITGLPQIVVRFDRARMAQYGLQVQDVNRVIAAGFAGETAGMVYEGDRRFDLVVRLDNRNRQSIDNVRNLYVPLPNATGATPNQIPLSQVATVDFRSGPIQIGRSDARRRITVGFNVRSRDVESVVDELRPRVDRLGLPPGYSVTYGGQFQNLIEARQRLSVAVPVALLLIFVLLYFTFRSVKQSLLVFTAIPLSAVGGVLALWLRGMPFSISAGVGFIALFGVSVLNGIVLIGYFNQLRREGRTGLRAIVLEGTAVRLRPVLLTALVASLGFLPMALSNTAGAEVQKPLATVVIGGLVTATLLTLLVLPVLYVWSTPSEPELAGSEDGPDLGNQEAGEEEALPRKKSPVKPWLLALLLPVSLVAAAQTPPGLSGQMDATDSLPERGSGPGEAVTLDQAIELALARNAGLRAGQYEVARQQALRKTASELGRTNVTLIHGQYNSVRSDNNLTITQDIPFPTVLTRQASLARASARSSELRLAVTRNELIYQVKAAYYQLAFLGARQRVLAEQDSLYANFAKAAGVRYRTGESNALEKATAESASYEARTLLAQNQSDRRAQRSRLQTLLHGDGPVDIPENTLVKRPFDLDTARRTVEANPGLAYVRQQVEVSRKSRELESARLLPGFNVGYFNQSLVGFQNTSGVVGAPEQYFDASRRFTGWQAGISVPLWFRPGAARVRAARLGQQVADANAELERRNLEGQYVQATEQVLKYGQSLAYYEQNALPQAELILQNAQRAFRGGDIGYVEYLRGLERVLAIKTNHLDILNQYNQAVVELEFIQGNQ